MDQGQFYSALGVVWVFGFVAVLLIAWHLRNKRKTERLHIIHEERMKAMEKGIPLPEFPEIEDNDRMLVIGGSIGKGEGWSPRWPLGLGALLIMGGLGTSVALMLSNFQDSEQIWPFGLIGVFVGVGFFFYYALTRTKAD